MRAEIDIPSYAGHGLTVRAVDIVEGLSQPFEVALAATSPDPDLDFERLVGAAATFRLDQGPLGRRVYSGLVSFVELAEAEAGQVGGHPQPPGGLSTYSLHIVPRLYLLSQRRGHRIFQHQNAVEIARAVLAEHQIDVETLVEERDLARHEIRVQYGETDLAFVDRILEEAGLSYLFDDQRGDGASHLVVTDGPERADTRRAAVPFTSEPSPTWELPFVADVRIAHETRAGKVTLADFDPRRPLAPRLFHAEQAGQGEQPLERYSYAPGASIADLPGQVGGHPQAPGTAVKSTDTPVADDQSFARADEHTGYGLAQRRLQAIRRDHRRVALSTSLVDLAPGAVFTIAGAPHPEIAGDQRLVVLETRIDGKVDQSWTVRVVAAFGASKVSPPRRAAWPRVGGLQSAVVMGPVGEEIHTDELGRVRVRFHWDREGARDDHRSAWVRVDEGWAGTGFGTISLPRVGQEVIVAFYEGNPDQPVVVGRLHDAENPLPRPLPGSKAETVFRTRSSPKGSGYHELSFDDTAGRERIMLRSERDLEKTVLREEVEEIQGDRATVVGGNLGATVGGLDSVKVGENHSVRLASVKDTHAADGGAPELTPLDTRREIIGKRITLTTGGASIVLDGPDITVTAQHEVSIRAGGTVVIQGEPYVQINPPIVTRKADAAKPPPPADHTVWFRLLAEGQALAGALVHLVHADGSTSSPQVTDGAGRVRLPVDKPGAYHVNIGAPPSKPEKAAPAPAPAPAPAAAKPATTAKPAASQPATKPAPAAPTTRAPITVGKTPAQPTAKAKPTDHAVPIAVEIVSPTPKDVFEIDPGAYPGPDPSMPEVPLKARVLVQGQETSVGEVVWEITLSGKYRVRDPSAKAGYRWQEFKHAAGTTRSKPNQEIKFKLAPAEVVGGAVTIKATFAGGRDLGNVTVTKTLTGPKVVGKDAPRAQVEKFIADQAGDLAWLFLRMFCHESDHTLAEFKNKDPRYGPPSGVGIAQQDPEEEEWVWPKDRVGTPSNFFPRIFWDWKKNVVSGMNHFLSDKVPTARRLIANLRKKHPGLPQPPEGLVMRAAIRAYNGGRELDVSPDGKHFVVSPHTIAANVGYVDWVLGDPHGTEAPKHPVPEDAKLRVWPAR